MSKQIVYATDFSNASRHAFPMACWLALAWNARLHIVHVAVSSEPRLSSQADKNLEMEELVRIVPEDIGVNYTHQLLSGIPAKAIVKYSDQLNADLIIMGTSGRQGFERFLLGSVASKVVRTSTCPVVTLRQSRKPMQPESPGRKTRILVPVDLSVHGHAALDYATLIAQQNNAMVTVLFVDDAHSTSPMTLARLEKYLPNRSHPFEIAHELRTGEPAHEITELAKAGKYNLIIMGTHGRQGPGRLLMGSVAEKVHRNADCPVLTLKPSNTRKPSTVNSV